MGHGVEVIIAYPTDEALGLEDKGGMQRSEFRKQNKRETQLTTQGQLLGLFGLRKRSSQKTVPSTWVSV